VGESHSTGLMMDTQYLYLTLYYVAFVTGIAGGCFANRFSPSGKRALLIGLLPWLSVMLITAPRFMDIYLGTGLSQRFCRGHPLLRLGRSLIVSACPLAFGLAIQAIRKGTDRRFAVAALGLSRLGMLLIWLPYAMSIFFDLVERPGMDST
jgi:hypothetical protein